MPLESFIKIANTVETLFHPLSEIVIHNLENDRIEYIVGSLSTRKKGDPSLLDKTSQFHDIENVVYEKINFTGQTIKSISVKLSAQWLMCINYNVTPFMDVQTLCEHIVNVKANEKPKSLFAHDWQEKINEEIGLYLKKNNLLLNELTNKQKKIIIFHLLDLDVFIH